MAKKCCREFQPPAVGRTKVTDDKQICDSKDPNVTYRPSHVRVKWMERTGRKGKVTKEERGREQGCIPAVIKLPSLKETQK